MIINSQAIGETIMLNIHNVAVIGAGNMGSQIAVYLATIGFKVDLYDKTIIPKGSTQEISLSKKAWNELVKNGTIASVSDRFLITPRNIDDSKHREYLNNADWVIEVVFEDLNVKRETFAIIQKYCNDTCIITSNTSGISIEAILADCDDNFKKRFFVTHFFNPVSMLPLLELVPGEETDPDLFEHFQFFAKDVLRKGIVVAKDTPNFIANRYGVFAIMLSLHEWKEGLSVAEVDEIFKIICGWEPLKTSDIVGLQLFGPVANNVLKRVNPEEDPFLDYFKPSDKVTKLVEQGFSGRKSQAQSGFFARKGKEKLMFDFASNAYISIPPTTFESLKNAMAEKSREMKLSKLLSGNDMASQYANTCLTKLLEYAEFLVDQICDGDSEKLDNAMKWGYNWPLGPIELGVEFGRIQKNELYCHDDNIGEDELINPQCMILASQPIFENKGAHVIQQSGAVYVFFHSGPVNSINNDIIEAIHQAIDHAEKYEYFVMIGNDNPRGFCAGADLKYVLEKARNKDFQDIERLVRDFQNVTQRMTYSNIPVLCVPHGLTLGGGSEIALAANLVVANNFIFWGQPELGVGLVPAGGGCMRLLKRMMENISPLIVWGPSWNLQMAGTFIENVWRTLAWCKQSTNARQAIDLGFMRKETDRIYYPGPDSQQHILWQASCIGNAYTDEFYTTPKPYTFNLPGEELECRLSLEADLGVQSNMFPAHNALVAKKIAHILCGGKTQFGNPVSEQDILDLEIEAFMSLVGTPESQKMMAAVVERKK